MPLKYVNNNHSNDSIEHIITKLHPIQVELITSVNDKYVSVRQNVKKLEDDIPTIPNSSSCQAVTNVHSSSNNNSDDPVLVISILD